MNASAKHPIPITPLICLYRTLRASSQEQHLKIAQELVAAADEFAARVTESISRFESYNNTTEAFCQAHPRLTTPAAVVNGRTLAAALSQGVQQVGVAQPFCVELVDYEVQPARTTAHAPVMLNQFEDGRSSRATMSIDLLLRREDGRPIIGEAKVAKINGYDTDAVLALVQALAAATQMATQKQQERLLMHYPGQFTAATPLDVAVVAYHPPELANATYQVRLNAAARALATALRDSPSFPPQIGNIHFLTARGEPAAIEISSDHPADGPAVVTVQPR